MIDTQLIHRASVYACVKFDLTFFFKYFFVLDNLHFCNIATAIQNLAIAMQTGI